MRHLVTDSCIKVKLIFLIPIDQVVDAQRVMSNMYDEQANADDQIVQIAGERSSIKIVGNESFLLNNVRILDLVLLYCY